MWFGSSDGRVLALYTSGRKSIDTAFYDIQWLDVSPVWVLAVDANTCLSISLSPVGPE